MRRADTLELAGACSRASTKSRVVGTWREHMDEDDSTTAREDDGLRGRVGLARSTFDAVANKPGAGISLSEGAGAAADRVTQRWPRSGERRQRRRRGEQRSIWGAAKGATRVELAAADCVEGDRDRSIGHRGWRLLEECSSGRRGRELVSQCVMEELPRVSREAGWAGVCSGRSIW